MKKIRIGGVPEHFNVLWHYALSKGYFEKAGLDVVWTDYPSGSAPMAKDLNDGVIDVAITLTDSITLSILGGTKAKIVGWYVKSPLVWGIHTGAHSSVKDLSQMERMRYAVSRLGSGSHLMALVDAKKRGIHIRDEQFVIVNNLAGAVKALSSGEADLFFWEKFTTKPYVDEGIFRRVGECPTPWPCFVIAASDSFLRGHAAEMTVIQKIIYETAKEFCNLQVASRMISQKYGLKIDDVNEWFEATSWETTPFSSELSFLSTVEKLAELGVIKISGDTRDVVDRLVW